jgi:hypothetical protein
MLVAFPFNLFLLIYLLFIPFFFNRNWAKIILKNCEETQEEYIVCVTRVAKFKIHSPVFSKKEVKSRGSAY